MPPEHYEAAVARAVERIRAGELEKIVLAREVAVHTAAPHDAAAVHGVLREAFPTCFVFAAGRGDATFLAASPELLLRREGLRLSTMALAGSTRRSADPAVDDHLGERLRTSAKDRSEHDIVIRRIARVLRPHAVWVAAAEEPVVVKVANIQHLATPVRAQLASPRGAVELAGLMHPTPAVGAEPLSRGAPLIPALEGLDRGWYAGPVGWTDANAARCCAGARPAATPASAWSPTPTRRPSSPRPRSSCRRSCLCWRRSSSSVTAGPAELAQSDGGPEPDVEGRARPVEEQSDSLAALEHRQVAAAASVGLAAHAKD